MYLFVYLFLFVCLLLFTISPKRVWIKLNLIGIAGLYHQTLKVPWPQQHSQFLVNRKITEISATNLRPNGRYRPAGSIFLV